MKVGDLVILQSPQGSYRWGSIGDSSKNIGVITHLWVGGSASVLFADGEYDVDSDDLEVINESG